MGGGGGGGCHLLLAAMSTNLALISHPIPQYRAPPAPSLPPCSDRWCVSDEHYLSVLLAARGEEARCSCSAPGGQGTPVYVEWWGGCALRCLWCTPCSPLRWRSGAGQGSCLLRPA